MNKRTKLLIQAGISSAGLLFAGFFLGGSALAERATITTVITVNSLEDELNNDGDCSLREAIAAANNNTAVDACPAGNGATSDTILFNLGGTITLSSSLDITADAPLVIKGASAISVSGDQSVRVLNINNGANLTLDGLTITEGSMVNGGGIHNAGTLTLNDSTIFRNHSMINNGPGGGIYNTGVLTITGSLISRNGSSVSAGGGIYNLGQLYLSDSFLIGNSAYTAGGGIWNSGVVTITRSTIFGNSVNYNGGGIYNNGTISVANSTIRTNYALNGGGMYASSGQVFLTNSTISGNNAKNYGGGIWGGVHLTISNITVADNSAGLIGGGIQNSGGSIQNSIIANNTSGMIGPDCSALFMTNGGYNLIGDSTECGLYQTTGDLFNVNPHMGPLQLNGGTTETHALLSGSPAINAGNPNGCMDHLDNPIMTDQRGVARNDRCDIGGFEVPSPIFSTHMVSLPLVLNRPCPDFYDDFSDPASGWEVGEDSNSRAEYLNGEYRVLLKAKQVTYVFLAPGCGKQSYVVEVDARWAGNSGASYGLIFGMVGNFEQFYLFDVNSDYQEFGLYRYGPQGWVELGPYTPSSAIHPGQTSNHLKVTRSGYYIKLEINGTDLGTWFDTTITRYPASGLLVSSYSNLSNADARFDNYRVSSPAITTSVQSQAETAAAPASQQPDAMLRLPDRPDSFWGVRR